MDPVPQASAKRAGIPRGLDAVITRGMAKKPEDRYSSAGDLAAAAHEALSDPDQDRAANIVRRSQEATHLGGAPTAPPSLAGTGGGPPPPPSHQPPYPVPAAPQPTGAPQYFQSPTGSWGGQPPGPPQRPGSPTSWTQAPPPAKRSPWPIVAGVGALVVVLVIAALGITMFNKKSDKPTPTPDADAGTTTSRVSTSTTSATPSNDPQSKLQSLIPKGYPMGTCKATTPSENSIWLDSVAMVKCGQNTSQGGPVKAIYGLFPNTAALKKAFDADIGAANVQLMNCPGEGSSPDGWHYKNSPNTTAGMIACATYKDQPNVIWSNESKLMLADVFGNPVTIEELHTWWGKNG
jgi:serine/threonine kinase PknH